MLSYVTLTQSSSHTFVGSVLTCQSIGPDPLPTPIDHRQLNPSVSLPLPCHYHGPGLNHPPTRILAPSPKATSSQQPE